MLTRDLVVALRQAAGRDEAVTATLELVCARLSASAGLAWIREPGGRWRLLRAVGDRSLTAGVLAREPEPEGDGAGVVRREHDDGTTVRVGVASWQGEPAAVLCFHGSAASPASSPEIEGLLEPVAELLGTVLDRLAERGLLEEIQRVAKVGSWEWHAASDTVWLSEQMYRNLGTDPERFDHTVAGYLARVHPEDRSVLRRQLGEAAAADGWSTVHRVVTEEGRIHVLEGHAQVTRDRHGVVVRLWGTGQDITERRQLEHELARRAERDGLTDLLDRPAFVDRLQRAMDEHRDRPDAVVVALVDIEDVRALNRQFGWAHGDRVLVAVAERLRRGLPDAVAAARLTDDTFAVRFDQPGGADDLDALGERIATLFDPADPLTPDTPPVVVRVGLAAGQTGVRSADELLRACGIALDGVAGRGGARWQAFDSVTHGRALQQLALESDLRRAVEQGKIELAYQPVLELGSGRVTGVEALARWHRADHGPVSPATFIPLAERLGLIHDLGVQVLERACRQLQAWTRLHPDAGDWHVAVNLAAAQLDDPDLIEIVEDVLRDSGLAHDRLVLEVTETSLSHDTPGALARLFELRRRGVRVAIDDFGTGYSSLSRLRELPFDILKVDRAFIQGIVSRAEESPILQALFFMTQGLALDVVAEGVETPMQLAALRAHGCGFAQGFLFSPPLAPADVEPLFAGPVPWDGTQLATEVTKPARSPLQQLLNGLVDAGGGAADDTLHQLLSVLASLTGLDSVYLTRIDLDDDVQEVLAAANSGSPIIEAGLRVPWSQTLCRRAVADGRQVVRDVTGTYPDSDAADRWGIRTYLGVQVRGSKGGLRGTLCGVTRRVTDVPVETVEALQWAARLLADPVEGRGISRPH